MRLGVGFELVRPSRWVARGGGRVRGWMQDASTLLGYSDPSSSPVGQLLSEQHKVLPPHPCPPASPPPGPVRTFATPTATDRSTLGGAA